MRIFRLSCLLFIFAVVGALAEDTNTTITINGVTYENFHWGTVTPTAVSIFHKTGVATIPLEKLPHELQKQFGYDPEKAAERRAPEQRAETPGPSSTQAPNDSGRKHPAEMMGVGSTSLPLVPTWIVFVNKSKELRKIYWLNFKGDRQLYSQLKPGETAEQQTYLGHPWVVTDARENALGLYYPDGQKRVVVLE